MENIIRISAQQGASLSLQKVKNFKISKSGLRRLAINDWQNEIWADTKVTQTTFMERFTKARRYCIFLYCM